MDVGFDDVCVHNVGRNQEQLTRAYGHGLQGMSRRRALVLLSPRTYRVEAGQAVYAPGVLEGAVFGHLLGAFALGGGQEPVARADEVHSWHAEPA